MAGCIPSLTLTEIIYGDDESFPIDPEAPKIIRNVPASDEIAEDVPETANDDNGSEEDQWDDIPRYGQGESDQEIEQSDTKTGNSENQSPAENVADSGATSNQKSEGGSSAENGGETGETSNGGGKGSSDKDSGRNKDKNKGENGVVAGKTFSDVGDDDELPSDVKSVAAVGNAAIVTAVLGGEDGSQNLVAADAHLLLEGSFSNVLAAKLSGPYEIDSLSSPEAIWSGDGSAAGCLPDGQLDELVDLKPDACLVSEDEETLSADQEAALNEAGIHVVYVPSMTSPEKIKACVTRIGALLEKGGDTAAANLAQDYVAFHDDVYGHYGTASATAYTLYVSDWETDVTYSRNSRRSPWSGVASDGVAVTRVGLSARVPSAYLEAAGVANAASAKVRFRKKIGRAIVWQVAGGTLLEEWSQAGFGPGIGGVSVELPSTSGFSDSSLLCVESGSVLYRLGDDLFSKVIAGNGSIGASFDSDRARSDGLYAYYDRVGDSGAGAIGTAVSSSDYSVVVNPCGLFSSWGDGSLESVLETAWACEEFDSQRCEPGYLRAKTEEFYQRFYGYDVSPYYEDIVAGVYAPVQ